MSTNTMKLGTNLGDKYIAPQQTITYKGFELFGYGYLDWGRVANQALVNLIDQIDILKDNGLSEAQFDLEEYTEEQTRLRTEEFLTWKSGFIEILDEKIQSYVTTTNTSIEQFKNAQNLINSNVSELIEANYTSLSEEIGDIIASMDTKITSTINTQLTSVIEKINSLTLLVEKSQSELTLATTSLNNATTNLSQLMTSFKTEFNDTFETFKDDTTDALQTNKEYLINYIDTKLNGTGGEINDLEARITDLELLSDSLNPISINTIITTKVNQIAAGVIGSYLDDYNTRLTSLETTIGNMDELIAETIQTEITGINDTLTTKFSGYDQNLLSMGNRVTATEGKITPVDLMRQKIEEKYLTTENLLKLIDAIYLRGMDSQSTLTGISIDYKSIIKNSIESIIDQNITNVQNIINVLDQKLLLMYSGLRVTPFNELSLIGDTTKLDELKTNIHSNIKTNVSDYANNDFKFMYITTDIDDNDIHFAFKLPKNAGLSLWSRVGINVINTRTNELIESEFYTVDNFNNPTTLTHYGNTPITGLIPEPTINPFRYSLSTNVSESVYIKFSNGYLPTDSIRLEIRKTPNVDSTLFINKTIPIPTIENSNKIDSNWINTIYPDLYKVDYTIGKDTLALSNPSFSITSENIIIPLSKIAIKSDGTKEFLIKVSLPTGATLTSIVFNDGTNNITKSFTNQNSFPLNLAEYTSRNLSSTNNYYKDICSTGVLNYPINAAATKVTGVVTYKVGTTTKTMDVTTASGGGGDTVFIEQTILAGQYVEIDSQPHFGSVDAKRSLVDVKVKDTTSTSETYNMYINGDNFSTIAIRDSRYIRIYNEFNSTLSFYIAITDR